MPLMLHVSIAILTALHPNREHFFRSILSVERTHSTRIHSRKPFLPKKYGQLPCSKAHWIQLYGAMNCYSSTQIHQIFCWFKSEQCEQLLSNFTASRKFCFHTNLHMGSTEPLGLNLFNSRLLDRPFTFHQT